MSYGIHPYPTWFDTLRAREVRHLDGYGLEQMVKTYAEQLPNTRWSAMRMSWMERVDEALAGAGSSAKLLSYFSRDPQHLEGFPYSPPQAEFPLVGYVLQGEMTELDAALNVPLPREEKEAIDEVRAWIHHCQGINADLITFYF